MASEPAGTKDIAVVLGPDDAERSRSLAADLGDLGHHVTLVRLEHEEEVRTPTSAGQVIGVPRLPVRVSPGFLGVSYRLYRTLEGSQFDALVFPDRGGHGYCCARARQLGLGFATTQVVVRCTGPTLRVVTDQGRAFISKNQVGTTAVERVTVRIADAAVCDDATLAWMREHGWKLPSQTYPNGSEGWAQVLSQPPDARSRPARSSAAAPTVSVVVTHYERPRLLSACLEALAAQTRQPVEVIVADDGSSSVEAVETLAASEARSWPWSFRILRLSHGGVHGARNAGWRAATGELVLFVDDDDVPFPELVQTLLAARAESGADVVSAGSRTFNGEGPPVARSQDVISLWLGEPYEMGILSNQYGGPTCLWPRPLLERLDGFADSFAVAEDWEILARAAATGAVIAGTPDPLFWNRQLLGGRVNQSLHALRDRSLTTVADHFSTELPETLSMLPLLAAGAYEELERRKTRSLTRRFRVTRRSRELFHHARSVAAVEGWRRVLARAVSSLVRRWG